MIYSNIWVGLAVAALSYISLVHLYTIPYLFLGFVLAATAFSYSYMRLVQLHHYRQYFRESPKSWAARHPAWIWGCAFFFGGLALYLFLEFRHPGIIWLLVLPAAISLLYPVTFKNAFSGFTSLRNVPGLKMFLIAVTWSYVTVLIPAAVYGQMGTEQVLEFVMRGLLILGLVIPFDIRDQSLDRENMKTLPQVLGVGPAKQIAILFVLLYQIWLLLRVFLYNYPLISAVALVLGFEIGHWLIKYASPAKKDSYFSFWLEGVPIFAALFLILAHWLF